MKLALDKFPEWRKQIAEENARGNPFVGHKPEGSDVLKMMDEIERLRLREDTLKKAVMILVGDCEQGLNGEK